MDGMLSISVTQIIVVAVSAIGATVLWIIGWLWNMLWGKVKNLEMTDIELEKNISNLEVRVSKEYVSQTQFHDLKKQLDRIEDKIDRKADK